MSFYRFRFASHGLTGRGFWMCRSITHVFLFAPLAVAACGPIAGTHRLSSDHEPQPVGEAAESSSDTPLEPCLAARWPVVPCEGALREDLVGFWRLYEASGAHRQIGDFVFDGCQITSAWTTCALGHCGMPPPPAERNSRVSHAGRRSPSRTRSNVPLAR